MASDRENVGYELSFVNQTDLPMKDRERKTNEDSNNCGASSING